MKKEYDFSNAVRNPYIKKLKRPVTIRLEKDTIDYFKKMAAEVDIPYQKLINLFLRDCAQYKKHPAIRWTARGAPLASRGIALLLPGEMSSGMPKRSHKRGSCVR